MTPKTKIALQYLVDLATSWGGLIKVVSADEFKEIEREEDSNGWSTANIRGHGLHWEGKRILAQEDSVDPGAIIHEMGHVFLDLDGPVNSDEMSWIGWEICLARNARCYDIWSLQNSTYYVEVDLPDGRTISGDWGDLSAIQRVDLIIDRIQHGRSIGIIDCIGNPLPRR